MSPFVAAEADMVFGCRFVAEEQFQKNDRSIAKIKPELGQ